MEIILKYFSDFTSQQLDQFSKLQTLYTEWNEKINVISRKDIDHLYERHVLHSLSIAAAFDFKNSTEIIDLGTGGGFPGIPLAIFFPEIKLHLVDSIAKKIRVVNEIAKAIDLKNISAEHSRIENISKKKFDFVVSRAVAPLSELWKWSKPILKVAGNHDKPGGLICLKGGDLAAEISGSRTRPRVIEISEIFPEEYFKNKYLLFVTR